MIIYNNSLLGCHLKANNPCVCVAQIDVEHPVRYRNHLPVELLHAAPALVDCRAHTCCRRAFCKRLPGGVLRTAAAARTAVGDH